MICAPNFSDCAMALAANSCPDSPVGNPKIVLDFRTGPGLSAGSGFLDDQDVEPFRSRIHCRGQARRALRQQSPGRGVGYSSMLELKPKTFRDLLAETGFATLSCRCKSPREYQPRDAESIEQFLRRLIGIEIEIREWMTVTRQKFSGRQRGRGIAGPEDDHVSVPMLFQRKPARQERLHEDLAELSIPRDERAQVLWRSSSSSDSVLDRLASIDGFPAGDH